MKTWVVIGALVLGGTAVLWFYTKDQSRPAMDSEPSTKDAPVVGQAEGSAEIPLLNVNAFMRNAARYRGTVRVRGVVSSADADKNLIALIDVAEFQACRTTTCAQLVLPIRWSKEMPLVEQAVVATGSVQDADGKRIFVASGLERVQTTEPTNR